MSVYLFKNSKCSPSPLKAILFLFITIFSVYICCMSMNQINVESKMRKILVSPVKEENSCSDHSIPPEEARYVHFPRPETYSRGECACTPVRFFVIVSMQRSGSGWFETLLNSHPNISSNGEIFSRYGRRANSSAILRTLDALYNLDWHTSAAKNECNAAFGLKWMLNQGLMDHHDEMARYFNGKGVSVIFLFRRNLLRRLISLLANDYDKLKKPLNGTHKAHVHSRQEAEILAQFKPNINISALISDFRQAEKLVTDCLRYFSSTRHMILYYEDIINNQIALATVQDFLGVPVRKLVSHHVKIHTRPLREQVTNWMDVGNVLNGTEYAHFLNDDDYED